MDPLGNGKPSAPVGIMREVLASRIAADIRAKRLKPEDFSLLLEDTLLRDSVARQVQGVWPALPGMGGGRDINSPDWHTKNAVRGLVRERGRIKALSRHLDTPSAELPDMWVRFRKRAFVVTGAALAVVALSALLLLGTGAPPPILWVTLVLGSVGIAAGASMLLVRGATEFYLPRREQLAEDIAELKQSGGASGRVERLRGAVAAIDAGNVVEAANCIECSEYEVDGRIASACRSVEFSDLGGEKGKDIAGGIGTILRKHLGLAERLSARAAAAEAVQGVSAAGTPSERASAECASAVPTGLGEQEAVGNWRFASGDCAAKEAERLGIARYGTAGVAILDWASADEVPLSVRVRCSVACPSCGSRSSLEIDCPTDYDMPGGPKATCPMCSSRVDFSVWPRTVSKTRRLLVTGTLFSHPIGCHEGTPVITIDSVE
ncbi:MAG: hypothetical protein JXL80_15730 [Planctomycetes bacterium]|nr:hypothetical protein [Planctomycetota bacterium]